MASGVSAARECAYAVVRRVFEQDAYADRAFHAEAQSRHLDGRDRGFAMALAYGGSRVLLIDADMRRPGLHKTMGLQNGTGITGDAALTLEALLAELGATRTEDQRPDVAAR